MLLELAMKNVLLLISSPRGDASLSTQVATELANQIPNARVTVRDLGSAPVPHIGPDFLQANFTPEANRTPEQKATLALSDTLIAELLAADVVVIGAGMINFGPPSGLKAWLDQVIRAGQTFRYGEGGPVGLVTGKKVFLVLATGGIYSSGPLAPMNHMEPHLQTSLGFLGMTDIEIVRIEGSALGPEITAQALATARTQAGLAATHLA